MNKKASRSDEWNEFAAGLERPFAQYRSEPRTATTMAGACRVWNAVRWRKTSMAWALDHICSLRRQVEKLRRALERDPSQRGRRGVITIDAPELRLPETIEAVREAYERRMTDALGRGSLHQDRRGVGGERMNPP